MKNSTTTSLPDQTIAKFENQEQALQFAHFTPSHALEIGLAIIHQVKAQNKGVVIDIEVHGRTIFHHVMEGAPADLDSWVVWKKNMVQVAKHSSMLVRLILERENASVEEKFNTQGIKCVPSGGGFPIIEKEHGVIGTIVVSGLSDQEDHDLIVNALRQTLVNQ